MHQDKVWSEEEMRYLTPAPVRRTQASPLRHHITARNRTRAATHPHEQTASSILYTPTPATHGNFIQPSYRRILAHPAWLERLRKPHTSRPKGLRAAARQLDHPWCELDTCTSSDALLMNILCYPRVLATPALPALLGVPPREQPVFGFKPRIPLQRNLIDTTEIDLKLGSLLIEAKLTEASFQTAPLRKLERYLDLDTVFDRGQLEIEQGTVQSYQLIRDVLAAHTHQASFCVLTDARRPELIESWFKVIRAVRAADLRARLRLHTWQELAAVLPTPLRLFLAEKYGIEAPCQ